ncbi:hypothetical protein NDU88_008543 [Pleurodeles waltl]|uniref:Uncharacterized protein n=1 Tax=Pleurodeles waltl TaxID=8319 RepID=A0AAV7PSE9_PLEWA|nr:hypothetical protein NDU88_008543 [Pleurodeles waltl]
MSGTVSDRPQGPTCMSPVPSAPGRLRSLSQCGVVLAGHDHPQYDGGVQCGCSATAAGRVSVRTQEGVLSLCLPSTRLG